MHRLNEYMYIHILVNIFIIIYHTPIDTQQYLHFNSLPPQTAENPWLPPLHEGFSS